MVGEWSGWRGSSLLCYAMLCGALLHAGCVVFGCEGVCESTWFGENSILSNKESSRRRMRMIFCERSMDVTKTSDTLTMSDVCGLYDCRPASRW
jgi:hypothetical protein